MRRTVVLLSLTALVTGLLPAVAAADDVPARAARGELHRLSGASRIETATEVSRAVFEPDVPVAFVATAERFPDALTGGPLAARIGAPILLTHPHRLPDATTTELQRLRPGRIVILGGTDAVSADVADALEQLAGPDGVDRIAGPTRFETAAEIAVQGFTQPVGVAFVATGLDFPDALSGAAAAAKLGGPVLLSTTNTLPDATRAALDELNPERIVILGGDRVVSDGVQNELGFYTDAEVERWAGADRFETAVQIAQQTFTADETTAAFVATGANFPDAVTGAAAAGTLAGPLLLTSRFDVPGRVTDEFERLAPGGLDVFVLGGEAVVSRQVADELQTYANPTLSSLSGTVTDAASEQAVAGALVELRSDGSASTLSRTDGGFDFEELVWGRFTLEASRLGYAPATREFELQPGEHDQQDVALERVASIEGRVIVFGTQQQIPGAEVTAQRVDDGSRVGPVYEAVTDDDGMFLVSDEGRPGLAPGSYSVRVSHDDYEDGTGFFDVVEGEWNEGGQIALVRKDE